MFKPILPFVLMSCGLKLTVSTLNQSNSSAPASTLTF